MPKQHLIVAPGPADRTVITAEGRVLTVPPDWELLPPGDAALTRRVKAAGPTWALQEKRGRKIFSKGLWCSSQDVATIRAQLVVERADPKHAKKKEAAAQRRDVKQQEYVEDFRGSVLTFLRFAPTYQALAEKLATAIAIHATPVGSGTVARTQRIPIEQRAEAATIAWLRHQTTAYDEMKIARIKGERREVRRELAEQSRQLLDKYRRGLPADSLRCPLQIALQKEAAAD
jgi:hypothetical protein